MVWRGGDLYSERAFYFICRGAVSLESEISDPQCGPRRAVGLGNSRKIYQLDGSSDPGADIIYHRSSIVQGPGYRKNRGFLERGICRNLELTRVEACSIMSKIKDDRGAKLISSPGEALNRR